MKDRITKKTKYNRQKGYTLLFSVLTAALVLGVAIFILSVSTQQYQLSIAARDSLYALYAADSALDCTLSDFQQIPSSIATSTGGIPNSDVKVSCNQAVSDPPVSYDCSAVVSGYDSACVAEGIIIGLPFNACATIKITDGQYLDTSLVKHRKVIFETRGYNYCSGPSDTPPNAPMKSPKTVERGLQLIREY